jgi:Tol biopolymer transport system component
MRKRIGLPWFSIPLLIYSLVVFAQTGAAPSGTLAYRHAGEIWIQRVPDGVPIQISQGGGENPQWSPSGEWLSFRQNGKFIVVPIKGNRRDAVTLDAAGVWSPVKDEFAFADADGLAVLSFEGNLQQKRVVFRNTKPRSIGDLAWSSDGTRLAFLANGLWRVNADGTGAKALFAPNEHDDVLIRGWSSDGRHVVVSIDPDHSASLIADGLPLAFVPVDGGRAHTFGSNVLLHPDFLSVSPDHAEALVSAGGGREAWTEKRVTSIDPATGKFIFLTSAKDAAVSPSWSPDGRRIVYASAEDAKSAGGGEAARKALSKRRIWIMNADGSQSRQLTSDAHYRDEYPQWSLDGRYVLFARIDEQDKASIWIAKTDNGELGKVVDQFDVDNPLNDVLKTFPNAKPPSPWFG